MGKRRDIWLLSLWCSLQCGEQLNLAIIAEVSIILKTDSVWSYCCNSQKKHDSTEALPDISSIVPGLTDLFWDFCTHWAFVTTSELKCRCATRAALTFRRALANQIIQQIKHSCWEPSFGWRTRYHWLRGIRCWHHSLVLAGSSFSIVFIRLG